MHIHEGSMICNYNFVHMNSNYDEFIISVSIFIQGSIHSLTNIFLNIQNYN